MLLCRLALVDWTWTRLRSAEIWTQVVFCGVLVLDTTSGIGLLFSYNNCCIPLSSMFHNVWTNCVSWAMSFSLDFLKIDSSQEQERVVPLSDPGSTLLNISCIIFTHNHLWLVIPSLNLVASCLHVSYYLYMHTFMFFRSTCLWLFSVDNPLRVATEALNIHLVSCILYIFISLRLWFLGRFVSNWYVPC